MNDVRRSTPASTPNYIDAVVNSWSAVDAALAYAADGLVVGPVKAGSKNPGAILGAEWHKKTSSEPAVIVEWYRKHPTAGVFIHTGPSRLVVFDLDKTEDLADLPPDVAAGLREAVFQRSRGQGDRGHYLFRTDERLGNSAGGFSAWGDVRAGNGVIVVSPSLHAVTGEPYRWVIDGPIPELPPVLRGLLRAGGPDAVAAMTPDDLEGFLSEHSAASAPERLNGPVTSFRRRVAAGESRHGALAGVMPWALREARQGVYSAKSVIDTFREEFVASFATSGDGQRHRPENTEYENLVRWAAAQPTPAEIAKTLWDKTPILGMVRRWAQEAFITPESLLGVGLLRALCAVPPRYVLPAIIGSAAQPNMFLGLVGESGTGKGLAEAVARDAFAWTYEVAADVYPGKPGSGEGIPKMFGTFQTKEKFVLYNYTRALMSLPEVDTLKSLMGRDSSTLSATLRELWSGETLGNDYSGIGNKVLVQSRRYRACLSIGIQPERGGPLFADQAGGLPQRFVFAATQDPLILTPTGSRDDLQPIPLPAWESDNTAEWRELMGLPVQAGELVELSVPGFVVKEVEAARERKMRKESGGLDSHRLLLQEKVALGFAVLHGKTHGFDPEHWEMAELFMVHSDSVRDETLTALANAAHQERSGRARAEGRALVERDEAQDTELRRRTHDRVLKLLDSGDWMAWRPLVRAMSKAQREVLEDVVEAMSQAGEITRVATKSGDTEGFKFRAGSKK